MLHWPQLCKGGELQIKNKLSAPSGLWLQKFAKTLIRETEILVPPKSTLTLSLETITENERYSLLNLNDPQPFEVRYKCNHLFYTASSIEGGVLTFKKSELLPNKLWIQNLYTGNNKIEIEFQNADYEKIKTETITLSSSTPAWYITPENLKNWNYLKISSSHKSAVFNLSSEGNELPLSVTPQKTAVETSASYFLIEPRTGTGDSFIVKITSAELIAKARDLIINPQKEKMLFALIQKDHQGFNRNWSKAEKSFWSWSTVEVTNFADLGSTACNGVPQEVDDRIDDWVADPGQICFWNYRVKKELSAQQVANGL